MAVDAFFVKVHLPSELLYAQLYKLDITWEDINGLVQLTFSLKMKLNRNLHTSEQYHRKH